MKKALIITYYWPPAGGPGVQRWLKFAKYLPQFGWEPIIYTPENPNYPLIDNSLLQEIPEKITTIKSKIWEPYQLAEKLSKGNKKYKAGQFDIGKNQSLMSKLSIFIRGNFFIPDARKFWVKPSTKHLEQYLKDNTIDCIITTGPPHSLHLIGLALKKKNPNIKWIADFRDPWTEISYYKHLKLSSYADKKHHALEKEVLTKADLTLATSYTDAKNFENIGANAICITNGFDFSIDKENQKKTEKFTISYIGVLEQLRNPSNLWQALIELSKENPNFKDELVIKYVGRVDDRIVKDLQQSIIASNITFLGYLQHEHSYKEMKNSDLLIITNFDNVNSRGIIPGKLFEYLATQNSIISIGPKEADVEQILNKTKAGKHFEYHEVLNIKSYIKKLYQDWKDETYSIKKSNLDAINQYSRRSLTEKLSKELDKLIDLHKN